MLLNNNIIINYANMKKKYFSVINCSLEFDSRYWGVIKGLTVLQVISSAASS